MKSSTRLLKFWTQVWSLRVWAHSHLQVCLWKRRMTLGIFVLIITAWTHRHSKQVSTSCGRWTSRRIGQHKVFFEAGSAMGYHYIRMWPEDEENTTHHDHFHLWGDAILFYEKFQHMMNFVFAPFPWNFVIVFLDGNLVYSASWSEHLQHLHTVMETPRQT